MTKKDYKLIAAALAEALEYRTRAAYPASFLHGHEAAVYGLSIALGADNDLFDVKKFIDAVYGENDERRKF